jgi:bla regulator protein BlaR1
VIRRPVRRAFGAEISYFAWLLVPITVVASLLPDVTGLQAALPTHSVLSITIDRSIEASIPTRLSVNTSAWVLGIWCAGIALCALYFVVLQRAFMKSMGRLSRAGSLLRAESTAGCPVVVGVLRPNIILPVDFESRYTSQEQALILAHEQVHQRRGDTRWNAVVALLRCLFWFNPLLHLAASCFRVDQELACDAAVVQRHPQSRRVYAGAMLETQLADAALPVGCHWRSVHALTERLEMLKRSTPGRARRIFGGAFLVIASLGLGYTAWAAEAAAVSPKAAIPLTVTVRAAHATVTTHNEGEGLFERVEVDFGPGGSKASISADHAHYMRAKEWVFGGNVRVVKGGSSFTADVVKVTISGQEIKVDALNGPTTSWTPPALRR